ncbi:MAG: undecaprenyl/decaprenyl-phosphate alpha-N-acetylglucosaminyl 1-phosphate transferase [Muribaculum sp.]|nr:undecaprenyl/decaprenyl-phosphate alpha-N-acetylglucosaminyl 1-phosphate transferase [Muribaculum sp.]
MLTWLINCLVACALCVLLAGVVIPQILLIAFRKQLFDVPDERKIHTSLVPRLGGIAFAPVIMFSMSLLLGLSIICGVSMLEEYTDQVKPISFGFCTVMMLYLVGMADDLVGIKYRAKFVAQIICGIMFILGGLWLYDLYGFLFINTIPNWLGWPLTVLVSVFIINAVNLIDGIDGLASGLSGIACLYYGLMFLYFGEYVFAMVSFATLGVLIPFFFFNVFGDPAKRKKIFMGDTGSLTIGALLCFFSMRIADCNQSESMTAANPIVLAFSPLIVPCFDVVRVYLHRVRNGRNPFLPDKNHIHHKLLAIGMRQRMAMVSIISVAIILTLVNILCSAFVNINLIVLGDILIWTGINIGLSRMARRRVAERAVE